MCCRKWKESAYAKTVIIFTVISYLVLICAGIIVITPIALGYRSRQTLELLGIFGHDMQVDKRIPQLFYLNNTKTGEPLCLGTLINANSILTSAQCAKLTRKNSTNFKIDLYKSENSHFNFKEVKRYPSSDVENDVAIVQTTTKVKYKRLNDDFVQLYDKHLVPNNTAVGLKTVTTRYMDANNTLDYVNVQLLTPENCLYNIRNSTESQKIVCAKVPDEWSGFVLLGSPLLYKHFQIGLASNVTLCKGKQTQLNQVLYTVLKSYGSWIKKNADIRR